jgi:hypothetical protein
VNNIFFKTLASQANSFNFSFAQSDKTGVGRREESVTKKKKLAIQASVFSMLLVKG